jgi:low temperature requirement protein LtrA
MPGAAKARRRAREQRQTLGVFAVVALALLASVGIWAVYFHAWSPTADAPRFALPSSTGRTVALEDFLGKQEVVLIF